MPLRAFPEMIRKELSAAAPGTTLMKIFPLQQGTKNPKDPKDTIGYLLVRLDGKQEPKPHQLKDFEDRIRSSLARESVVGSIKKIRTEAKVTFSNLDGTPLASKEIFPEPEEVGAAAAA